MDSACLSVVGGFVPPPRPSGTALRPCGGAHVTEATFEFIADGHWPMPWPMADGGARGRCLTLRAPC
eukprot:6065171-Prymnesium_polylepis.1